MLYSNSIELSKQKKKKKTIDIDSMGFVVYHVLRQSNARIFEADSRMRKVKYKLLRSSLNW